MKRFFSIIFVLCFTVSLFSSCSVENGKKPGISENVFIVSSSEKFRRQETVGQTSEKELAASLAKREGESMQFILNFDKDVKNVRVNISDLVREGGNEKIDRVSVYKEYYVYCEQDYNSSALKGDYPDALIPIDKDLQINNSVDISANNNQGYWITVNSAADQMPGIYKGEVTVSYDGGSDIVIPVSVEIWDFEIPAKPSFETAYALWDWDLNQYIQDYGDPAVVEKIDFAALYRNIFEWFFDYRISSGCLPVEYNSSPQQYAKNHIEYLKAHPEVSCFSIGQKFDKDFINTLEAEGYLQYGYTYVFDEPMNLDDINEQISEKYKEIHSYNPNIRNMLTTSPREDISDCDIWCPCWSAYGCDEYVIRDSVEKGAEMWWYGCIGPRAPYPTYHIMDKLMTSRLVHWMQKDFNVTGNLYWSTTDYGVFDLDQNVYKEKRRDIWTDPYVFRLGDGTAAGVAGDGILMYMGLEGDGYVNKTVPVPSLRLESIRDGSEDYEYLVLLENKVKALFEKWNITDITVDEFMDTYYDALYNSMGDFDTSPKMMLEMRKRVAHDLLNAESLVMVSAAPCSESVNRRLVRVFAENGSAVTIGGETVKEKNMGAYSVYDRYFDMSKTADFTDITVAVNGIEYERTLKSIEDSEYMFDAKNKVQNDAKALGLENASYIRDLYAKNTFVSFVAPSLGNLDEQLQNDGSGSAVQIISSSKEMRDLIVKAIAVEAENTIPVAVLNKPDLAGKGCEEIVSVYVPASATVKVNGKDAVHVKTEGKVSVYTARVDTGDSERVSYELSVTYGNKTEKTTKFLLNNIKTSVSLVDFSNPELKKIMDSYIRNKGMVYEQVMYEGEPALKITFKGTEDTISIPGAALLTNKIYDCEYLYLDIVNLQSKRMDGVDMELSTDRDRFFIPYPKTAENYDGLLVSPVPSEINRKVSKIAFCVGRDTGNVETGCGSYLIKGVYAVWHKPAK